MFHALHALISNDVALNVAPLLDCGDEFRASPADGASAWGFGSIQERRALVKRRPRLGNHVFDFGALVGDAPSRVVVGVVVGETQRPLGTDAIPPFRFQNWLMAGYPLAGHSLDGETRSALRQELPDHVRRTLEGESDAELISHTLIGGIAMQPTARNADFPLARVRELVLEQHARLRTTISVPSALDAVVTNGRAFLAVAHSRPLYWRRIEGLDDDPIERERRRAMHLEPRATARPHFRALLLTSLAGISGEWSELKPGNALTYTAVDGAEVMAA